MVRVLVCILLGTLFFLQVILPARCQFVQKPPYQTPLQAKVLENMTRNAKEWSEAAVPELMSYMDSFDFRSEISDLPFANESSSSLLQLLQEQIRQSPLVHNIDTYYPPSLNVTELDMNLTQLINSSFMYNYWELTNLNPYLYNKFNAITQNQAETLLFGFPDFTTNFTEGPPPFDEAIQRPYYTALNVWNVDAGNPIFGGLGTVFFPDYARPLTFLNPMDTGIYEMCCKGLDHIKYTNLSCIMPLHCKAWNGTQGTLEHFNHLILPAADLWGYTLGQLFQRWFQEPPMELHYLKLYQYWEADFAGAALIPDGVQYFIAGFYMEFGTSNGTAIQQYCIENGIPLVWALGLNTTDPKLKGYNMSSMFLDPVVGQIKNVSVSSSVVSQFNTEWTMVNSTLAVNPIQSWSFWQDTWNDLYSILPLTSHLHYTKVGQCRDNNLCFTVDDNQDCVCVNSENK
eukprot:TRINITY_DN300_c0_g2_i1.p1 TRINITY_DN300_c0_g2~~TRINITY_DN300_c0_g2_i1.p1  ORF type:complete len:457 (-),score=34.51 TRINITY_DN300_c0_g2_i1:31-1401(-)